MLELSTALILIAVSNLNTNTSGIQKDATKSLTEFCRIYKLTPFVL